VEQFEPTGNIEKHAIGKISEPRELLNSDTALTSEIGPIGVPPIQAEQILGWLAGSAKKSRRQLHESLQLPCSTWFAMGVVCFRSRVRSRTIPPTTLSFNIATSIGGTVAIKC
jgi:hypothetical protein